MAEVFVSFNIDGGIAAYLKAHKLLAHHGFHSSLWNGQTVALPPSLVGRSVRGATHAAARARGQAIRPPYVHQQGLPRQVA